MLLIFGTILKRIRLDYDQAPNAQGTTFAHTYESEIGGHGALQAFSAARSCIRAALVGSTGDGYEAGYMLPKLRLEGLSTSAVTRQDHLSTGTQIDTYVHGQWHSTQLALEASGAIKHDQIPDDVLKPGAVVLCQNEVPPEQNSELLARAKKGGATTIMLFAPRTDITAEDYTNIDYLIVQEKYAAALKGKPREKIILFQTDCSASILPMPEKTHIPAPQVQIVDMYGAIDTFCGTFAAGIYDKMPVEKAVRRACAAAALNASKKGGYPAMPYGADIEEALKT